MTSQQKKKRLKNKADRLWQQMFVQQNPECLFCGQQTSCGHHFIPKSSSYNLRYNFKNGIPVCYSHHSDFHSKFSANIIGKTIIIKGEEWFKEIDSLSRIPAKDFRVIAFNYHWNKAKNHQQKKMIKIEIEKYPEEIKKFIMEEEK